MVYVRKRDHQVHHTHLFEVHHRVLRILMVYTIPTFSKYTTEYCVFSWCTPYPPFQSTPPSTPYSHGVHHTRLFKVHHRVLRVLMVYTIPTFSKYTTEYCVFSWCTPYPPFQSTPPSTPYSHGVHHTCLFKVHHRVLRVLMVYTIPTFSKYTTEYCVFSWCTPYPPFQSTPPSTACSHGVHHTHLFKVHHRVMRVLVVYVRELDHQVHHTHLFKVHHRVLRVLMVYTIPTFSKYTTEYSVFSWCTPYPPFQSTPPSTACSHGVHHTHLFKVHHRVLCVLVVYVRELDHQVHEVGVTFLSLVHHLDLAERQPIQPVDLHHVTIPMFLTQLGNKKTQRIVYFMYPSDVFKLAEIDLTVTFLLIAKK